MKEERSIPDIIRSVADGDRMVLTFPDDDDRQLQRRNAAFSARASEINWGRVRGGERTGGDGWQHYRIIKVSELRQIIIIASRKEEDDGSQDGTQNPK